MTLFPYQRIATLFELIQTETLPQEELAKRCVVSTRTIRTDIRLLNEVLQEFGAQVIYARGTGYYLKIDDADKFSGLQQQHDRKRIPRTAKERINELLFKFLLTPVPLKLDELAESWFVSRATLQNDLVTVRERLLRYNITLETVPRVGLAIKGQEQTIRRCITDILWQLFTEGNYSAVGDVQLEILATVDLSYIEKVIQNSIHRYEIRLSNEGCQYLVFSCAVSILRITWGYELLDFSAENIADEVANAIDEIAQGFAFFLGTAMNAAEKTYLSVQLSAYYIQDKDERGLQRSGSELVHYILSYINDSYNYDLRADEKLKRDLTSHLSAMMTRLHYRISSKNPLLTDIKSYYPFAYDVAVSAMTNVDAHLAGPISEDELGYLAVHIGVGLERNYNKGYTCRPQVLMVSNAGNATLRMIEAKVTREFPQIDLQRVISPREYDDLAAVDEDFVITTVRLTEKGKPIVKIAPFPTPYQMEQLGWLAMQERTKPYILNRFFDEKHFMIVRGEMTQQALFKKVCGQLEQEGYVMDDFYPSLVERESIVSTMLGENIALPHALGLMAKKTVVVTILAPQGIVWNKERKEVAHVIFLLAISKAEYEEAMAIYDLFVTFVREKATRRLLNSNSFHEFQIIAKDSLGRSY